MNRILKILLCATLLLGLGQEAAAQFRYAGVAGASITNLRFKQDLAPISQVGGFQAGVQSEMMFPGIGFGLGLGLIYNMAGANVDLGQKTIWASQGYGRERIMLHQLHIPFHLRFKWTRLMGLEDIIAPLVYGGPGFDILLAHSKCDAIDFSGGNLDLTVGFGVELYKRWQVTAERTWGMTYALKTKLLSDYSARPRQWTLRVAYFF